MAEYTTPLPPIRLPLTLMEIYTIYCAGAADATGGTAPPLAPSLASLLTTLRDRYLSDHADDLLHALDDAPAWLAAQRTLKAREV